MGSAAFRSPGSKTRPRLSPQGPGSAFTTAPNVCAEEQPQGPPQRMGVATVPVHSAQEKLHQLGNGGKSRASKPDVKHTPLFKTVPAVCV